VPLIALLHFTPDGVSARRHVITINITLLTEGAGPASKKQALYALNSR